MPAPRPRVLSHWECVFEECLIALLVFDRRSFLPVSVFKGALAAKALKPSKRLGAMRFTRQSNMC